MIGGGQALRGKRRTIYFNADLPMGEVNPSPLESAPVQSQPVGIVLVKLFVVPAVLAVTVWLGGWAGPAVAFLAVPAWALLYTLLSSELAARAFDHLLLYRLRAREIASQERVRLAEIEMQRAVNLASAQIEAQRGEVARAALLAANRTPKALLLRTPAEEKLIRAVVEAYKIADPATGYLPNHRTNPFGKRALGAQYSEIVDWLQDPGRRHNVMGAPPVAIYDKERRSWRLNLERYPTPDAALRALTGH